MKNCVVKFIDALFPYHCRGCGEVGGLLCFRCRKNIACAMVFSHDLKSNRRHVDGMIEKSGGGVNDKKGRESTDKQIDIGKLEALYVAGWREGVLKKLVEDYKFKSVRSAARVLAGFLDGTLPEYLRGGKLVIVPLPTISKHIRARGFDHTYKLAHELARMRNARALKLLKRVNSSVQVGSDEEKRKKQASEAYEVDKRLLDGVLDKDGCCLLIDDVWTTGASMRAAAEKVAGCGAKRLYGAVIEIGR